MRIDLFDASVFATVQMLEDGDKNQNVMSFFNQEGGNEWDYQIYSDALSQTASRVLD